MALLDRFRSGVAGFVAGWKGDGMNANQRIAFENRIQRYEDRKSWYRGQLTAALIGIEYPATTTRTRKLRRNLCQPICNIGGGFAAGPSVSWAVSGDEDLTKAAQDIWSRSEGDGEFLISAVTGAIIGDLCAVPRLGKEGQVTIQWLDPAICIPTFSVHDCARLDQLEIRYPIGENQFHREVWSNGRLVIEEGDEILFEEDFSQSFKACPAVWIPNQALRGDALGTSDLECPIEAIVEYDHLNARQSRIIDYYTHPTVVVEGTKPANTSIDLDRNPRTVFYSGPGSKVYFLEWQGPQPGVKDHIEDLRADICEMSETPRIAFGRTDSAFTEASGVALRVLFGPLLAKTARKRAVWGPRMERLMHAALRMEGHSVEAEQVNVLFADPAPEHMLEQLDALDGKVRLGLSKRAALAELHYSEEEIKKIEAQRMEEQAAAAEMSAKLFDRGVAE